MEKYFGGKMNHKQSVYMWLIVILLTMSYNFFSFRYWTETGGMIFSGICLIMFFLFLTNSKRIKNANFTGIVLLLAVIPYLSIINSASIFNQPIVLSILKLVSMTFVWMLYFMLHIFRVKEGTILKALLYLGILIVAIQSIQQFTYPNVLFGVYNDSTELASMRNGIYRFRMDNNMYYTLPILFVILGWLRDKFDLKLLFISILFFISVYLTLTRQIIFSVMVLVFVQFFIGKKKFIPLLLGGVFVIAISIYYNELFGTFVEQINDEIDNSDYIRILAAEYYWNDSTKDVSTFLFGYGIPTGEGLFQNYCNRLSSMYFFSADVGFIGKLWHFGVFYIICAYYLLYCILVKFHKKTPMYIRLFMIFATITSIMIFPFESRQMMIVFPLLLYICDLHINNSSLILIKP